MQPRYTPVALLGPLLLVAACGGAGNEALPDAAPLDGPPGVDAGADAGPAPGPEFGRYCRADAWDQTLVPATVGAVGNHDYLGAIHEIAEGEPVPAGMLEAMKVIPDHPFLVRRIRVAFGGGTGPARLRLITTFGRTYPASYPEYGNTEHDVMPPVTIDVADADAETWYEADLEGQGVFLLPGEHYLLMYEHVGAEPFLAVQGLPPGEDSRALLFLPGVAEAYGLDGNYRLELEGSYFCSWDDAERWFGRDAPQPFAEAPARQVAVADLNGDGLDDLLVSLTTGRPVVYLGDGTGLFAEAGVDPFPDLVRASFFIFGDVDNDGDQDAFAATYVDADRDGDGVAITEGDCNDVEVTVKPGATETPNGRDDDCDGMADNGLDQSDADGDGATIKSGDCDDTRDDVFPGAPELLDGRDNDCDLRVDEDFVHHLLLNDGSGSFTTLPAAGVELLSPATAGGFGDGDNDGFLDLYLGNWLRHYPSDPAVPDFYFVGRGDGTFTESLAAAGMELTKPLSVYGVEWTDYNNDGLLDIFVGNYHLYDNQLWQNLGSGQFTDVALAVGLAHDEELSPYSGYPGGHTYGGDFGDYDNDGDLDFYMCNLAHPRVQPWSDPSMFAVSSGAPDFAFVNRREALGLIYDEGDINAAFGDYDNDGDLDLVIGTTYPNHYSRLYRNDGDAGFTDVTYESGTVAHQAWAVLWADVDHDGDLDLLMGGGAGPPYVRLYTNRVGQDRGWVVLLLEATTGNRDAVGARVEVTADGVTRIREVSGGGGHYNPQKPKSVHFGLGEATTIETVTVRWPGGATETITGITLRGRFKIVEGTGVGTPLG